MALVPKVKKIARNFRQLQRVVLGTIIEKNLVPPAVHGPFLVCSSLVSSRDFPRYPMGSRK